MKDRKKSAERSAKNGRVLSKEDSARYLFAKFGIKDARNVLGNLNAGEACIRADQFAIAHQTFALMSSNNKRKAFKKVRVNYDQAKNIIYECMELVAHLIGTDHKALGILHIATWNINEYCLPTPGFIVQNIMGDSSHPPMSTSELALQALQDWRAPHPTNPGKIRGMTAPVKKPL
jgi:hypothetical protein